MNGAMPYLGAAIHASVIAPFQRSSDTSKDAALKIEPARKSMRRETYVAILAAPHGLTRKELEAKTGLLTQTLCARLNELENAGRITKLVDVDNEYRTVKRSGCSVYVAVLQGPYSD